MFVCVPKISLLDLLSRGGVISATSTGLFAIHVDALLVGML